MKRALLLLIAVVATTTACLGGNVFELKAGDCFNDPDSFGEVSDVEMVDCADPHDNEVYALLDVTGDDYPGDFAIQNEAGDRCLAAFAGYVGIDFADSVLDFGVLTPTSESWGQGDKEIVCFLFHLSGDQLGSSARNLGI